MLRYARRRIIRVMEDNYTYARTTAHRSKRYLEMMPEIGGWDARRFPRVFHDTSDGHAAGYWLICDDDLAFFNPSNWCSPPVRPCNWKFA